MILSKPVFALAAVSLLLTGCNAGAIAFGQIAQRVLNPVSASGSLANAPAATKVGYLAWIELLHDGTVSKTSRLNFDLVANKNVAFDKVVSPVAGKFAIEVAPAADVAEGTYVLFAWDDTNANGAYDGEQGEKRAPEVYRLRGQAATKALWTTEKFVFTEKKLAIEYASHEGGLSFGF